MTRIRRRRRHHAVIFEYLIANAIADAIAVIVTMTIVSIVDG